MERDFQTSYDEHNLADKSFVCVDSLRLEIAGWIIMRSFSLYYCYFYLLRNAMEEVRQDLQERLQRWHNIEEICGFPIVSNPGLVALKQALRFDSG